MSNPLPTEHQAIIADVSSKGLVINGKIFDAKMHLSSYRCTLSVPSRTIEPGPPAPIGHRNNQVHLFDGIGVYLTEHHASGLIESVNFALDPLESLFPIEQGFIGHLNVFGVSFGPNMKEGDLPPKLFQRDLPGEYSLAGEKCLVYISALGRRNLEGKRSKPRYVVCVSICF